MLFPYLDPFFLRIFIAHSSGVIDVSIMLIDWEGLVTLSQKTNKLYVANNLKTETSVPTDMDFLNFVFCRTHLNQWRETVQHMSNHVDQNSGKLRW